MILRRGDELGVPNKKLHDIGSYINDNLADKEKAEKWNGWGVIMKNWT